MPALDLAKNAMCAGIKKPVRPYAVGQPLTSLPHPAVTLTVALHKHTFFYTCAVVLNFGHRGTFLRNWVLELFKVS